MELLADENVETEWVQALSNGGHDMFVSSTLESSA